MDEIETSTGLINKECIIPDCKERVIEKEKGMMLKVYFADGKTRDWYLCFNHYCEMVGNFLREKRVSDSPDKCERCSKSAPLDYAGLCFECGGIADNPKVSDIDTILASDRTVTLKNPVKVNISFSDGEWHYENDILGIIAHHKNKIDAKQLFFEDFNFVYENYYLGNPNKMIGNALTIRAHLLYLVDDKQSQNSCGGDK